MMSHWNVKPSTLVILACVTFLMLLIVVLPDVDLPDAAFHRGTAPVVVHAQASTAPAAVTVPTVFQLPDVEDANRPPVERGTTVTSADPNLLPILLRSIRC